jgi:HK97 family phage prohead protease
VRSGTLKVAEDDKGLAFRCQLDKNQQAHRDLHASVKRGDISECSFAFSVPDGGADFSDGKDETGQRCLKRTLRNVTLHDVSVVTHPAYPQTSVDARAAGTAPAASVAEIAVVTMRFNQQTDSLNRLHLETVAAQIRQGGALEVGAPSPRNGQTEDPTQSLRDDDDDFDFDDPDWDKDEHERCATYHRCSAHKAPNVQRAIDHFKAADAHQLAAESGSAIDSCNARLASRLLLKGKA